MTQERIVLFSVPTLEIKDQISEFLFPLGSENLRVVFMPSDGSNKEKNQKYIDQWQAYAQKHYAAFDVIDNSKRGAESELEKAKIDGADILVISGGNTFLLMKHLHESGLDKSIKEFYKTGGKIAAYSAGAIVLSPSLETATQTDNSEIGLEHMRGLGIFEELVVPHADNKSDIIEKLKKEGKKVIAIKDSQFVTL